MPIPLTPKNTRGRLSIVAALWGKVVVKLGIGGALFAVCIGLWSFTLPKLSPDVNTYADAVLLGVAASGLAPFLLGLFVLYLGLKQENRDATLRNSEASLRTEKLRKEIRELDIRQEERDSPPV
jgi:hypothetical protein